MSAFKLPKKFHPDFKHPGRKPVGRVEIDWKNKFVPDGFCFFAGIDFDLVSENQFTVNAARQSDYLAFDGSSNYVDLATNTSNTSYTILVLLKSATVPASAPERKVIAHNVDGSIYWDQTSATFRHAWVVNNGTWNAVSFGTAEAHKWRVYAASVGAAGMRAYVDGVLTGSNPSVTSSGSYGGNWILGRHETNDAFWDGDVRVAYLLKRQLSDGEVLLLSKDPYQILKPASDLFYFPTLVSGTTVNATKASITATANQATLNDAKVINATTATMSVSTFTASVTLGLSVNATVAAANVTAYQATINDATSVDASTAATNITTLPAAVSIGSNITASTASISTTALTATVNDATSVSVTQATVSVTTFQAAITVGNVTNINATTATVSVSAYQATIFSSLVVGASVANVGIIGYRATIGPRDEPAPAERTYTVSSSSRSMSVVAPSRTFSVG